MELFSVGSRVKIGGAIIAEVTAICIRQNLHTTYEVVWWDNNVRRCEWLEAFELVASSVDVVKIGFISEQGQ